VFGEAGLCLSGEQAGGVRRWPAFARSCGAASCFWHGCPRHFIQPRGNAAFWRKKIAGNRARDRIVNRTLRRQGWKVLRIWECHPWSTVLTVFAAPFQFPAPGNCSVPFVAFCKSTGFARGSGLAIPDDLPA